MNWALINGEREITLSAIVLDAGVDTGDVLGERTFAVGVDETIADVHAQANAFFPELLVEVLRGLDDGTDRRRQQEEADAAYWPLRLPDDGLLVWDQVTARQAHDRIRALAPPYPGAFTFWRGRRVKLLRSVLEPRVIKGEPGRIYALGANGMLVCATDRCLRITSAILEDDGSDLSTVVSRYDEFATARKALLGPV
jgi:methionyl-tRNA formyltransferase